MKQIFTIEVGISTIVAQPSAHGLHLTDLPPITFHMPPLDPVGSIWASEMVESKKLKLAMAKSRRGERELAVRKTKNREGSHCRSWWRRV